METRYENRELDEKFNRILEKMDWMHTENKQTLEAILSQTKKTNGRVSVLEEKVDVVEMWKSNIMGKIAVASIVVGSIWSIVVVWLIKELL